MILSFTIPDDKLEELKTGFFRAQIKPDGVSDLDWFKTCIKRYVLKEYVLGKRQIAEENLDLSIDEDVIS